MFDTGSTDRQGSSEGNGCEWTCEVVHTEEDCRLGAQCSVIGKERLDAWSE